MSTKTSTHNTQQEVVEQSVDHGGPKDFKTTLENPFELLKVQLQDILLAKCGMIVRFGHAQLALC